MNLAGVNGGWINVAEGDLLFPAADEGAVPGAWRKLSLTVDTATTPSVVGRPIAVGITLIDTPEYGGALGWLNVQSVNLVVADAIPISPAVGAVNVPTTTDLQWGMIAESEGDVYFGNDYNAVLNANTTSPLYKGRQAATTYQPSALNGLTEYFWRVDTVIGGIAYPGSVWNFTTDAGPGDIVSWSANYFGDAYTDQGTNVAGLELASYWNDNHLDGRSVDLLTDNGVASTIDISTQDGGFGDHSMINITPAVDTDGSYNKRILNGYVNAPTSVVALTEIGYASYDIIVYFSSDKTDATGNVTDGTTTYYFKTLGPASISGGNAQFVQATDTTTAGHGVAANYAVFSGLSGASQTLSTSIPLWGGIAAVQVVNRTTPPVAADFNAWIAGYPGVGTETGFDQDPDRDGIASGLENFFGTNPGVFSQGLVLGASGTGQITFTHPQNPDPADDLSAPSYEWSKDLLTFHADGDTDGAGTKVDFQISTNDPEAGITTLAAVVSGTDTGRLFIRVGVSQLPSAP
jgi:hypothetical protein